MNEKEALIRIKTGNFNDGHGFNMQLLVDTVGVIGEMFKNEQIGEIVRCEDCRYYHGINKGCGARAFYPPSGDWFCADAERR